MALPDTRQCSYCKEIKSIDNFPRKNGRGEGSASFSCYCKECSKTKVREWKSKNRERARTSNKKSYQLHKESKFAYTAKWREENREKVRTRSKELYKENIEHRREYARKWHKQWLMEHRDIKLARYRKREAIKMQVFPIWANIDRINRIYFDAKNKTEKEGKVYHVDHIVPLKSKYVCGLHCEDNLQILPASINISKGNRIWPNMPQIGGN